MQKNKPRFQEKQKQPNPKDYFETKQEIYTNGQLLRTSFFFQNVRLHT